MSCVQRLRRALWFFALLPTLAAANTDVADALLRPDCKVSADCLPGGSAVSDLSLNGGVDRLFLDWRPLGGTFFATAGTFTNQNQFGYDADVADMVPTSNISLKPLKPYIGTYLGLGWKSSASRKFMWMVDLGIVEQRPINIVQNIHATSGTDADAVQTSTTIKWRASSKRVAFTLRMKF